MQRALLAAATLLDAATLLAAATFTNSPHPKEYAACRKCVVGMPHVHHHSQ
jgi:hypothetical protein